jgi:hypothetical protein
MSKAFDVVTETMVEIGALLKCYAKFAVAYETSDEVRERLVASYKNIVKFWATVTKLLDQNRVFPLSIPDISFSLLSLILRSHYYRS